MSFEDKPALEFFETSGRNLLVGEAAAGAKHHVALSVGTGSLRFEVVPVLCCYFPREAGSRKSDQGFPDSLHDRPRHAVLRVRGWHCPIGGLTVQRFGITSPYAAYGLDDNGCRGG